MEKGRGDWASILIEKGQKAIEVLELKVKTS